MVSIEATTLYCVYFNTLLLGVLITLSPSFCIAALDIRVGMSEAVTENLGMRLL